MKLSNSKTYIVEFVIEVIKENALGKENALHGSELRKILKKSHGIKISDRELREIISIIRSNWKIKNLIAGNKGYFIAVNKTDIHGYTERIKSIIRKNQIILDSFDNENVLDHGSSLKIINYNDDW